MSSNTTGKKGGSPLGEAPDFSNHVTPAPITFRISTSEEYKLIHPSHSTPSMAPLATVGILSIGEMGVGIAKLLIAHNYRVVTNIVGRRYAKAVLPTLLCFDKSLSNVP